MCSYRRNQGLKSLVEMTDEYILFCLKNAVKHYHETMNGNYSEKTKQQYRISYPHMLKHIKEYEAKLNAASK